MNYTIKVYQTFKRQFKRLNKRYKSLEADVDLLVENLLKDPCQGTDLGRCLRKVRMAISAKGKGKSGGARVITLILAYSEEESEIGLLYIYDKSERESLTDSELTDILRQNELL